MERYNHGYQPEHQSSQREPEQNPSQRETENLPSHRETQMRSSHRETEQQHPSHCETEHQHPSHRETELEIHQEPRRHRSVFIKSEQHSSYRESKCDPSQQDVQEEYEDEENNVYSNVLESELLVSPEPERTETQSSRGTAVSGQPRQSLRRVRRERRRKVETFDWLKDKDGNSGELSVLKNMVYKLTLQLRYLLGKA